MTQSLKGPISNMIVSEVLDTHTTAIARIVKYDAVKQKASVQPLTKYSYINGRVEILPQLIEVPVQWPSGGGAIMTFPLKAGDNVIIVFSERAIDTWKESATNEGIPDPVDPRNHHISDAIAIPCISSFSQALGGSSSDVEIRMNANKGNEVKIALKASGEVLISCPGEVTIDAGQATVNSNLKVNGNIQASGEVTALSDLTPVNLSTHVHPTAPTGPISPPTPGT